MLIFDLDGTLIDSAGDLHRFVNQVLAEHKLAALSLPEVRAMVGDGVTQLVTRAFAARSVNLTDPGAEVKRFLQLYAADPVALTDAYVGVRETLSTFREQGIPMAVSTNKPESISREILRQLDLLGHFKDVIGGDSRPYRKPDPRMLTELIERFGATARDTFMIGDSEVDAATAAAAQVPFVLMTYGYRRGAIDGMTRVATLDRFADLSSIISPS
jgi:phosphoglycolate phosphatase